MNPRIVAAAAVAMTIPMPASAQIRPGMASAPMEPYSAYGLIASGNVGKAESTLVEQSRMHPDAPEISLNLASVYVMTGRGDLARPLYERVRAMPPMDMDMPDGSVRSSHLVAERGMTRIGA